jgi:hypothetical protein
MLPYQTLKTQAIITLQAVVQEAGIWPLVPLQLEF